MSNDAGDSISRPRPIPLPPKWLFKDCLIERLKLKESISIAKGVEMVPVSEVIVVQLVGQLDPGDMKWYDSYIPTLRIGNATSSRMTDTKDGVQFIFYPEVDGDLKEESLEFRARTSEEFSSTGLRI